MGLSYENIDKNKLILSRFPSTRDFHIENESAWPKIKLCLRYRKWLFDGTELLNKKLFDGTLPSNMKLYDGTPKKGERGEGLWREGEGRGREGVGEGLLALGLR